MARVLYTSTYRPRLIRPSRSKLLEGLLAGTAAIGVPFFIDYSINETAGALCMATTSMVGAGATLTGMIVRDCLLPHLDLWRRQRAR